MIIGFSNGLFSLGSKSKKGSVVTLPAFTINSVNLQSGDLTGQATTDGVIYNVYAFNTTGVNYTINYTAANEAQAYVLAVGGGGSGGCNGGGGGGAGGVVMTPVTLPVTTGTSTITVSVGAGGYTPPTANGSPGTNSTVNFTVKSSLNITAGGGASGGNYASASVNPNINASGGGAGLASNPSNANTGYLVYANGGGTSDSNGANGGGGGAGSPGINGTPTMIPSGGNGIKCGLPGIKDFAPNGINYGTYYWGGGGGGSISNTSIVTGGTGGNGGLGGGGGGVQYSSTYSGGLGGISALNSGGNGGNNNGVPGNGGVNTGGGGGGSYNNASSTSRGGSGIVIIAFPVSVVVQNTNSLLTNTGLSSSAYNSIKAAYGCTLLNYNYTGPIMCLRYSTDTYGSNTQNFFSDTSGNLFTGPSSTGSTVQSWLASNNASQLFAYVTKWYDQGMDISFNNAYQYTTSYQPIYDVVSKVINFGYTGPNGGIPATQAGYLNLPLNAFPILDSSFTIVTKYYNHGNNNSDTQADLLNIFSTSQTGAIQFNSNGNPQIYFSTAGSTLDISNGIITYKYTSFSSVGSQVNNYVIYQNSTQTGISSINSAFTTSPQVKPSIGNGPDNYYANSGIVTGSTTNYYLQAQLYYLYIFGSALSDSDRAIIESTPVRSSISVPTPDIIWLKFNSTTYTGNQTLYNAATGSITCNFWSANGIITNYNNSTFGCCLIKNTNGSSQSGKWNITSSDIIIPLGTYGLGYSLSYWILIPSNGLPIASGATCMLAKFNGTPNSAIQGWINTYYAGNYFNGSGTNVTNMTHWFYQNIPYNDNSYTNPYNTWYHITIVQMCTDNNKSTLSFFKNGTRTNTTTSTYPTSQQTINFGLASTQSSAYYSDVRVYGRPLENNEVTAIYNYGISTGINNISILPQPVLYFPFSKDILNYATGTGVSFWRTFNATNAVGGSYGTGSVGINNTIKWNSNSGGSLEKTAGTSCLYGPAGYTLPTNQNGYTISFWYYYTVLNSIAIPFSFFNSSASPAPINRNSTYGSNITWMLNTTSLGGIVFLPGAGINVGGQVTNIPNNTWLHIIFSLSTSGNYSIYYIPITTTTIPSLPSISGSTSYTSISNINDLRIFGEGYSGSAQSPYSTTTFTNPVETDAQTYYISDFYLFDSILDSAQLQYLHKTQQFS